MILPVHDSESASDKKHDLPCFGSGPFRFQPNLQAPPITRRFLRLRYWTIVAELAFFLVVFLPLRTHFTSFLGGLSVIIACQLGAIVVAYVPHIVWRLGGKRRDERRLAALKATCTDADAQPRIDIRGRACEFAEFLALPDTSFEPRIYRTNRGGPWWDHRKRLLFGILAVLGGVAFAIEKPHGWPCGGVVLLVGGVLLSAFVWGRTYVRLIPGRIDGFEFSIFSTEPVAVESLDLRKATISIDLSAIKDYVIVSIGRDTRRYHRHSTLHPLQFALDLAWAARSSAPTPAISMKSLIG